MKKNSPISFLILFFLLLFQNGTGQKSSASVSLTGTPPLPYLLSGGGVFTAGLSGTGAPYSRNTTASLFIRPGGTPGGYGSQKSLVSDLTFKSTPAFTSGNPAPSSLLTGIISYWTLDETAGNAIDITGDGNNGTPSGVAQGAPGKINTAYGFNGTTSKVDMGASANLAVTTGSVSCWIYMLSLPANDGVIFEKGDMSNQLYGYGMYYSGGNLVFETANENMHTNYPNLA